MLQSGGELDLTQEPLAAEGDGDLWAERLERDEPLMPRVAREVHERHAAASQLTVDDVVRRERGIQLHKGISHSG